MIVVDRAYASFAVLIPFLKVVAVNKVANVTMLEFVDIKVADRIDSFKVADFIDDEVRSGRLNSVCFVEILNFDVSSYINWLFHLIFSIALMFRIVDCLMKKSMI